MKKMKMSDSELKLLFLLISLLLIAASYFLVFNKGMAKAETIEEENAQNQILVQQLQNMVARRAQVEEDTVSLNQEVEDIIARYPSDVTTEKAIVIVQDIENISGMHVSSIGFLMGNLVSTADVNGQTDTAETTAETTDAGTTTESSAAGSTTTAPVYTNDSFGYYAELTINYSASYESFKNMITYINGIEDRMTIPSITGSYDSTTGELSGTITVNMYYLTNTGKEYEDPEINRVQDGVTDIFGTLSVPEESSQKGKNKNAEQK